MSEGSDAVTIGRRLEEILRSHCDTPVSDLLSGLEPVWICQKSIEDLREENESLKIMEEANYDLSKDNARMRATIITWSEAVSPAEQIETIKKWLSDGGQ